MAELTSVPPEDNFASKTQAYREVLLGCLLVRIADKSRDVSFPYVGLGEAAYNGRTLDEQVVNPFLREKNIPCSKGPYLSVFRRSVAFVPSTREGLKDKKGFDALLRVIEIVRNQTDDRVLKAILGYLVHRFLLLREESHIDLIELDRISLSQYRNLITALIHRKSGGRLPLLLVVSMFEAIAETFSLAWSIEWQGINVADSASGVSGDITIKQKGISILVVEVTERIVDSTRVASTFKTKIAPAKIPRYVFMVHLHQIDDKTQSQADRYFAQGYDVTLVDIWEWLVNSLVTIGGEGRQHFQTRVLHHLSDVEIPKMIRVIWNEETERLLA